MNKLPAFQFYPSDWRSDNGVQALDFFERGVWFEILCLMHESEQRGKLLLNGKPMPNEALARLLGLDNQILTNVLTKLLEFGVMSVEDNTGIFFNRRMVKDENLRQIRQNSGKLGGNPNLVKQNSTKTKKQVKQSSNQNPTPSSSFSSSLVSTEEKQKESQEDYLIRKQLEYPKLNVYKVFDRYLKYCARNQIEPSRRFFDHWLKNEEEPMTAEFKQRNLPTAKEVLAEREKEREKIRNA